MAASSGSFEPSESNISSSNHQNSSGQAQQPRPRIAAALLESLRHGYDRSTARADILAGIVVGIVALPLSMALAIATGLAPQYGLYTAIIAGGCTALLGGSRYQVTGPTAAFVIILAPIVTNYGIGGLLVATIIAGLILILLGALKMGKLIQYIPYTVVTGFTAGIAIVLATLQLKDFLGLRVSTQGDHFHEIAGNIYHALPTAQLPDILIGLLTLTLLVHWPKISRAIPGPLVALTTASVAGVVMHYLWPDFFQISTIQSQFSYTLHGETYAGIPSIPPTPLLPWTLPGPGGQPLVISWEFFRAILPSAFAIAMLGAIESLLSAVIADGMTGDKHDPDSELIGQGVGNVVAPFFGGFAATGALARTATNIRNGAKTPFAAVTHAIFVLLAMVLLAPLLGYLPMAAMAALLLVVAWNMSEARHLVHVLRIAPRADSMIMVVCLTLTVIFDMVVAVTAGIILAALLFMQRMATLSDMKPISPLSLPASTVLPSGVVMYEIAGPLFFGAAQKAMSHLQVIDSHVHTVVVDMHAVPLIDATGLMNLESTFEHMHKAQVHMIIANLQPQPRKILQKARWCDDNPLLTICRTTDDALSCISARQDRLVRDEAPQSATA